MDNDHDRDSTSRLQDQNERVGELFDGEFPQRGRFSGQRWAKILGVSRRTIERYVYDNNIPHKKPGDEIWIDAEKFWDALPDVIPSERPKQRGGNRRKGSEE